MGLEIKKGDLVEFTDEYHFDYTLGDKKLARYGVAIQAEDSEGVVVELADGSQVKAKHIHAASWGGWIPEELEEIWEKYNNDYDDMEDDWDYPF